MQIEDVSTSADASSLSSDCASWFSDKQSRRGQFIHDSSDEEGPVEAFGLFDNLTSSEDRTSNVILCV